jgi:hypothetical protein
MFPNTIKVFIPYMNHRVSRQYVFNTFSKFNLGTIGEISMREKYTTHRHYTCMVEFLSPPQQAMYTFFNYIMDENADVKIKTKYGLWKIEEFKPKFPSPPEEEIIIDFKQESVLTFDRMNVLPESYSYYESYSES